LLGLRRPVSVILTTKERSNTKATPGDDVASPTRSLAGLKTEKISNIKSLIDLKKIQRFLNRLYRRESAARGPPNVEKDGVASLFGRRAAC
jgi:hypothetical protein